MKMRFVATLFLMALTLSASAKVKKTEAQPEPTVNIPDYSAYILTPPAPATPRINSAKVFGVHPNAEILYTIAATGERPMTFSAEGLPAGVTLDATTGRLSGRLATEGTYHITLTATNAKGSNSRELRLVVGDRIALTPPMGWNSWNCWGPTISQEKVLASARALVEQGMHHYGWSYINIDDGWQGKRGGEWNAIQPNAKFPDMKGLADEIHSMGLKFGIYSGPWVATYAGHIGTHSDTKDGTYPWIEEGWHDDQMRMTQSDDPKRYVRRYYRRSGEYSWAVQDAKQWAAWGVDYLKYDWKPNDIYNVREMREALDACGRDIVYSISNTAPYADAYKIKDLTECWRTTGDIRDTWESVSSIGFDQQDRWAAFHGPGHWGDADMLVVGMVGGWKFIPHYSRLTPDEQYTHITLWALLASPMLIGCDIALMDDFTRSLLCNFEVNDILQDPLGMRAMPFYHDAQHAVYVKLLEGGDVAVGLFNLSDVPLVIEFEPRTLGLWDEAVLVRDVWRQTVVSHVAPGDVHEATVAPHGCVLYRLSPGNSENRVLKNTHYRASKHNAPRPVAAPQN